MSLILIDEFEGDNQEFYEMTQEEIKKREIPGIKFLGMHEVRSKGWFAGKEAAPFLDVYDDDHEVKVLAYQFGRSFHISTRAYWRSFKMAQKEKEDKLNYLDEVRSACFSETVDRAVRAALSRHLEKHKAPVPPSLNPRDVFYTRKAQTGQAEG